MIAAMIPEDRFSGIALAKFGSFAEVVHGPDLALGKSTDLVITRSRKAAAEPIGEGFKPPNDLTLPISSKADPRLIALVRILARQAARDFIQAAWDGQERAASRIKEGFLAGWCFTPTSLIEPATSSIS
jgi:hypothetical protein